MGQGKVLIVTQARVSSTRFRGKVLHPIAGTTVLGLHLSRLKRSRFRDAVLVATTNEPEAEAIAALAQSAGCRAFRGALEDVLDRFYQGASLFHPSVVVRVTADCPLNDGVLIDSMIERFDACGVDYLSNTNPPTFPDGMDIEVFSFAVLERAWSEAKDSKDREHVTPYIRNRPDLFSQTNYSWEKDLSTQRLTVDYPEDLNVIKALVGRLGVDRPWVDYARLLAEEPEIAAMNGRFSRNEGF